MNGERMRFEPMSIGAFMSMKIPKQHEHLSLLGRYKEYLIENSYQHHYGVHQDLGTWLNYALKEYHNTFGGD